jgi:copper(I)-binding protein
MKRMLLLTAILAALSTPLLAAPSLEISDPWVREPNPARPIGAAFMTITNPGDEAVSIVGASSKAAEVVEIHEMKMEDGMMKMRMIESLEIPAHGTVKLEPGGYHLMLIRLTGKLVDGDSVEIELKLSNGEALEVKAPVKKAEMDH